MIKMQMNLESNTGSSSGMCLYSSRCLRLVFKTLGPWKNGTEKSKTVLVGHRKSFKRFGPSVTWQEIIQTWLGALQSRKKRSHPHPDYNAKVGHFPSKALRRAYCVHCKTTSYTTNECTGCQLPMHNLCMAAFHSGQ